MKTRLAPVLVFFFFLCGCVTSSPPTRDLSLKAELMDLDERMTRLEEELGAERQKRREQFVRLEGQLDRYRAETRKAASEKAASQNKTSPEQTQAQDAAAKASEPRQEKQPSPATPKDIYHKALDLLLEEEKPAQAQAVFEQFIDSYPEHSLLPNAYYWLGECYYVQKKYARSIVAFKKVFNRYPETSKAADALLKMGYAYGNLEQKENAAFYLQRLREKYPSSHAAKLGRQRLEAME